MNHKKTEAPIFMPPR